MRPIDGRAKSVRELLSLKYSIDYYQREYRWEAKQVQELIDDLSETFLGAYEPGKTRREDVAGFPHYFLGSIITSQKEAERFIVDGQQRLTSLTLLLILLRNLQGDREEKDRVNLDDLIFSSLYGKKTFNLAVDEREPCMEALFANKPFDPSDETESVQNLYARYQDMQSHIPDELRDEALPFFTDWLIENVHLVEVSAYSDRDAYMIFETMNDRGRPLTPTEMLKGYLLANIDASRRGPANQLWRRRVQELTTERDDHGADFFKAWLRSQHALTIRDKDKGANPEDFERIGSEYHRWVRDEHSSLRLDRPDGCFNFIDSDFDFYSRQYLLVRRAQAEQVPGLDHILYNTDVHGVTLPEMLLLAPLCKEDDEVVIRLKLRLVARFIDILIAWRIWNHRSIAHSTMRSSMFTTTREIRGLSPQPLAEVLHAKLIGEKETFATNETLRLHGGNRSRVHWLLARMTDYLETKSGQPARYAEYMAPGKNRYEIEHIWADHSDRHEDEFSHPSDFDSKRNRIGGLLLLPHSFNASYRDLPYEEKLPHYSTDNLLARSLHPLAYERNPGFTRFVHESKLPFRSHEQFKSDDLDRRGELYRLLAERIWDPDDLLRDVSGGAREEGGDADGA